MKASTSAATLAKLSRNSLASTLPRVVHIPRDRRTLLLSHYPRIKQALRSFSLQACRCGSTTLHSLLTRWPISSNSPTHCIVKQHRYSDLASASAL